MCALSTSQAEIMYVREAFKMQHKTHMEHAWFHHGGPFEKLEENYYCYWYFSKTRPLVTEF